MSTNDCVLALANGCAENPRLVAPDTVQFATFATAPSRSLQQTLYCMGKAVLEQRPEMRESFCAVSEPGYVDACRFGARLITVAPPGLKAD